MKLIQTIEELNKLEEYLLDKNVIVIDTETSSLYPWRDGQVLAGLGLKVLGDTYSFYIPVRHKDSVNIPLDKFVSFCYTLIGKTLVGHNIPYDLAVLFQEKIYLDTDILDTVVMWRLVSEDEVNYKLKYLAKKYIDPKANVPEQTLKKYIKKNKLQNYGEVPAKVIAPYVEGDLFYAEWFYISAIPKIQERGLQSLLKLEQEVAHSLFFLQKDGFLIDRKYVIKRFNYLIKKEKLLEEACFQYMVDNLPEGSEGLEFFHSETKKKSANYINLDSSAHIKTVFHSFGVTSNSFTDKNNESWDKDSLVTIDHPLARMILAWRAVGKLKDFYKNIDELADSKDIVHCSIHQAGAKTGRMSCTDPNLQQLPSVGKMMQHYEQEFLSDIDPKLLSKKDLEKLVDVRGSFIARPGYFLLFADFQQQELRIMADYASEDALIEAFGYGFDAHAMTARSLRGELPEDADESYRKWWRGQGKDFNFGLLYGLGLNRIAALLDVGTTREAKKFREQYFERFPGVLKLNDQTQQAWLRRVMFMCTAHREFCTNPDCEYDMIGWVKNKWGRRRYLREFDKYKIVNFLVQGSSADQTKDVYVRLNQSLLGHKAHVNLIVHDEFIFEIAYEEAEKVIPIILKEISTCDKLDVPMSADLKWSPDRWSNTTSLSCDNCNGLGKTFNFSQDELFTAVYNSNREVLDKVVSSPCKSCSGAGYDLRRIKND